MNRLLYIASLAVSLIFVWHGAEAMNSYRDKAAKQNAVNMHVIETKESWNALSVVREKWNERYKVANDISDLYGVFEAIELSETTLTYESSVLVDGGRENVQYDGVPIGLAKACVKTDPRGVVAHASDLGQMLDDLKYLESRGDIEFKRVTLADGSEGKKLLVFDAICVLLRGEDKF